MCSPESSEVKEDVEAKHAEATPTPLQTDTQQVASLPSPSTSTTATTATTAAGSVAADLFARLKPFLSEHHIEVEARLCNFSAPQLPHSSGISSDGAASALQVLTGSYGRINVGVSADDFARMRHFIESEKKLMTQHTEMEDIITSKGRYTYAIAKDGSECFVGHIVKTRLCNVEVYVPNCPYDVRLSVSTEVPRAAAQEKAPPAKPHGFRRRKSRWTATESTYEYAFTRVGGPAERHATYEVEIEAVQTNAQEGVTVEWLDELLRRLLTMAQLEGNTGLPKSSFVSQGRKRQR